MQAMDFDAQHEETRAAPESKPPAVLLFGEVLADRFPDGDRLGGAPFNVAWHLRQLAPPECLDPVLLSRVGRDDLGRRVLAAMDTAGLLVKGIQHDPLHGTGVVDVSLDPASGEHRFSIPPDQAWDHIHADTCRLVGLARRPRWIYFGTLAQRALSRQALRYLKLTLRARGFLDVNLRPPGYARISCTGPWGGPTASS